jgi:ketosteroid isomerase-like protein
LKFVIAPEQMYKSLQNQQHRSEHITMTKIKKQAVTVGESADDIEAAFYEALQTADIEKLMACWADEDEIVCVHPGGPRLVGMGAIRVAFEAMFANSSIRAWPEGVRKIEALASVVHNVRERIEVLTEEGPRQAYVIATNVYHKTPQGWRMVVHHASPGSEQEAQEISETPHVFH